MCMGRGSASTLFYIKEGNIVAEKNNATCSICGNSYYKCLSCRDSMKLHPYKNYCCSVDCYKVFQIVRGYNTGIYNKDEFKCKLENINLSDLENYEENIKTLIKDVLKEDKPVAEIIEQIETIVETNDIVKEIVNEVAIEEKPSVQKVVSRKRNYKVETE